MSRNLLGLLVAAAAMVTVLVPVSLTQQPQSVVGVEGDTDIRISDAHGRAHV
jgi:hypothetical protein